MQTYVLTAYLFYCFSVFFINILIHNLLMQFFFHIPDRTIKDFIPVLGWFFALLGADSFLKAFYVITCH